jgi:hypothetical protein
MPDAPKVSMLINDLSSVPNIIGGLGLSIAAAQKAFNLDYLENLEQLLALIKATLGGVKQGATAGTTDKLTDQEQANVNAMATAIQDMLKATAPPRYQYSETTLSVKLDLAQTMQASGTVGLGIGYGALSLNAAFTIGYGYDYRAAAECHTVIHAIPADPVSFQKLLDRSKDLNDKSLELPAKAKVDQAIFDQSAKLLEKMTGVKAPATKEPAPTP